MLKSQEIAFSSPDITEKISKIFGIFLTSEKINQYDLFVSEAGTEQAEIEIQGKEVLRSLIDTGLISDVKSQKIEMQLENLEGLPEKAIEYIANSPSLKLQIQSFRGLNNGVLEKIGENEQIHYFVEDDIKTSTRDDTYYSAQDMQSILEVMETIKQSLPENATDIQKFMTVYKAIAMSADYDRSGCQGNKESTREAQLLTRSLKGVLIEGRAVCRGYAVALKKCLDYVGIESEVISGYAYNDPNKSHTWNQVKIEGKWYNADLTWDKYDIRTKKTLEYCLKNDEEFYKDHTVDRTQKAEQCRQYYPIEEIQQQLEKMHSELDEHCENLGKGFPKLVGISEYKENANQHRLDNTTYEEIKSLIKIQSQNIEVQQDMEQGE